MIRSRDFSIITNAVLSTADKIDAARDKELEENNIIKAGLLSLSGGFIVGLMEGCIVVGVAKTIVSIVKQIKN